jgi:thioesterase domain-containing protein/acyl carrier protein
VLNPVPIGVHGELHIGGHGVTAGYLNRPDLTREKFILDVFGEEPDSRLYKTGDIARYLPDGNIEFLGRRDGQIKLRGFRIELGEIESAVSQHPQISESTVVLTEEGNGNKGLVAYVAARSSALLSTSDLRRFLEKRLPDYMIPSRFVLLEALPRTANRKVDHAALPSLGNERPILHSEFTPPRTRLERIAAEVWADTLGIDRVGVHDNFFELGGHSLLATRLIARLRETFGVDLPLKSIFTEPTVATFAKSLEYQEGLRSYVYCPSTLPLSSIVPIQTAGSRIPLFLVAGAHGDEDRFMRYLSNLIPHLGVDQPVYGLKPRGLDGKEKSQSSVEEMATDYLKEVRDLWPNGPYILVGECVGGIVAYEMAQRLLAEGRKDVLLILMDTHMPSRRRAAYSRLMYISRRLHSRIKDLRELLQRGFRGGGGHLLDILRRKRRVLLPLNPEERTFARIRTVELSYRKTIYRYRPEPYPGKLVLLVNEVRHARSPMLGWEKVNLGGIEVHAVPGDHLTRLTVHGRTLAQQVRACLDTAQLDPFEAESKPQQSGRGNPSN